MRYYYWKVRKKVGSKCPGYIGFEDTFIRALIRAWSFAIRNRVLISYLNKKQVEIFKLQYTHRSEE